jgi:hypothetical protein
VHTRLSSLPQEREQREKTMTKKVERINSLEECYKLYEERTQVCNQLIEYAELQEMEKKL